MGRALTGRLSFSLLPIICRFSFFSTFTHPPALCSLSTLSLSLLHLQQPIFNSNLLSSSIPPPPSMGSTLSTMSSSSSNPSSARKTSADSLDLKPSLFQRSKASFSLRAKKSSHSSLSQNTSSNPHIVPSSSRNASASASASSSRQTSIDSLEGRSDHSVGIRSLAPPLQKPLYIPPSNGESQQHQQHPHQLEGPDSQNSSMTGVMPSGTLPEWAHHSRKCEDGRTRHTVESAPYMLPNDLTESDRLDAQHYLVRFVFKGNYNVKLDSEAPLKILDVATGTGVWALEMAHEFPKAEVYGVDISSIFPTEIKPSNCHFQLCNILDGLPFPDNTFDFIYQRLLVYALTPAQRKQVYSEVNNFFLSCSCPLCLCHLIPGS